MASAPRTSRTVITGLSTIRRRITIGATTANSRPTSPAVALPTVSPRRSDDGGERPTATTTMIVEVRKIRRCAPAVCSTYSRVPPLSATLMTCPTGPMAAAETTIVSRMRIRTTPKSSCSLERLAGLAPTRLTWGAARDHRSRW